MIAKSTITIGDRIVFEDEVWTIVSVHTIAYERQGSYVLQFPSVFNCQKVKGNKVRKLTRDQIQECDRVVPRKAMVVL